MELPNKKYEVILADPPWQYNELKFRAGTGGKLGHSGAIKHYPTMTLDAMLEIPVQDITAPDCLLFMWAASPQMDVAIELGKGWGFDYKTVAFVWDKRRNIVGHYTMSSFEVVLVFKHGRIPKPRGARNVRQKIVEQASRHHSQKPLEVHKRIELMFPEQSRIELFARQRQAGWDCWGNEIDKFAPLQLELDDNGKEGNDD